MESYLRTRYPQHYTSENEPEGLEVILAVCAIAIDSSTYIRPTNAAFKCTFVFIG